jgi:hypothetical protein
MFRSFGFQGRGKGRVAARLSAIFTLVFLAACNDPQAPAPGAPADLAGSFQGGTLEFKLESAGQATSLVLVATDLQFDPATEHLRAQVAVRNDGTDSLPGPQSIVVFDFVPSGVRPLNALCAGEDPAAPLRGCAFDHRGTYGDDGILSPGETSTPVEWILLDPHGDAFSFHAQIGPREAGPGIIAGVVFADRDRDGQRDAGEAGIATVAVHLHGSAGAQDAVTDAAGRYLFEITDPGIYTVLVQPPAGSRPTSPLPLAITILRRADGSLTSFGRGDIGLERIGTETGVTVQGHVFEDLNHNGVYDAGEPGLAGVTLKGSLADDDEDDDKPAITTGDDDEDDDGEVTRAVSDSEGFYALALPAGPGPWQVRCESVDGFDRTTPKAVVFTLPPPVGEVLHADFGFVHEEAWPHFEVRGTVYLDGNRNGHLDAGEVGVAELQVEVWGTACPGLSHAADATNSHGRYSLDGEDVGCGLPWVVSRAAVPGYVGTTPDTLQLEAAPGTDGIFTVDFGIAPVEPPVQ